MNPDSYEFVNLTNAVRSIVLSVIFSVISVIGEPDILDGVVSVLLALAKAIGG